MPRSFGPTRLRERALARWCPIVWLVAIGALVVRLYLASLWFRFGMAKIDAGWLTVNPVRGLLTVVGAGQTPMPIPSLSVVAQWLLAVRADIVLSVILPLTEVVLAAAFLTGWYVRHAAIIGIAVNTSLIIGGLASVAFDGKIIALQASVLLAGGYAGMLGAGQLIQLALRPWRRSPGEEARLRAA